MGGYPFERKVPRTGAIAPEATEPVQLLCGRKLFEWQGFPNRTDDEA